MLFTNDSRIGADHILVQIHIPRTAGTSMFRLFNKVLGQDKCLKNYRGEIECLSDEQMAAYRMIAGHFQYGIHQHLRKLPVYVSVMRNPIDRYISTYAEFLTNPSHPFHQLAQELDINAFLRHGMVATDLRLKNQFNNLQCRMISGGHASFEAAHKVIDEKYFLVCPQAEINTMTHMIATAFAVDSMELPQFHETHEKLTEKQEQMQLSLDSIALLLEIEREDMLLFAYVEKAFSMVAGDGSPFARLKTRTVCVEGESEVIPPTSLRFMGEADDRFLQQADRIAELLLSFYGDSAPKMMLDIGCGYGRLAYGLRRCGFAGNYTGFDILTRQITWLQENFRARPEAGQYRFEFFNTYNERYNPEGLPMKDMVLPYALGSFDCLISSSVFTHLYEEEAINYVRYLKKYMQDGALWIASFFMLPQSFSLDNQPTNCTFPIVKQVSEHGFIHSLEEPLKVSAFREDFLLNFFAREGLEVVKLIRGNWYDKHHEMDLQDWFVLRKLPDKPQVQDSETIMSCNICVGHARKVLALSALAIQCGKCGSSAEQRVIYRFLQAIPIGFLDWRHGLQIGGQVNVAGHILHSLRLQDIQAEVVGSKFDLITIADETLDGDLAKAEQQISKFVGLLSDKGVLLLAVAEQELRCRLASTLLLCTLTIEDNDPCSGARFNIMLLFKQAEDSPRIEQCLRDWSDSMQLA